MNTEKKGYFRLSTFVFTSPYLAGKDLVVVGLTCDYCVTSQLKEIGVWL